MSKRVVVLVLLAVLLPSLLAFRYAGSGLVVNTPKHADLIVVLAGDDNDVRYWRGVELMHEGWAPKLMLDVVAKAQTFGNRNIDLAQNFINRTTLGQSTICPIYLNSTYGEAQHLADCLRDTGVKSVLVVTSEYHTRRALEILQKRLPQYRISMYAAPDPTFFGQKWWQSREWAKTTLAEWQRYLWWRLVDRWRSDLVAQ
ncbi:MAG TPA: YdcF family protein [Candidatus Angelobacter sp.]|nr:YdcF family protein [Candidatus Angelobacter sp.]